MANQDPSKADVSKTQPVAHGKPEAGEIADDELKSVDGGLRSIIGGPVTDPDVCISQL